MAEDIHVPALSEMEEASVAVWHKAAGDWVEPGAIVADVDTGKVTVEVEAMTSGYLEILAEVGDTVTPGMAIARLLTTEEKAS